MFLLVLTRHINHDITEQKAEFIGSFSSDWHMS